MLPIREIPIFLTTPLYWREISDILTWSCVRALEARAHNPPHAQLIGSSFEIVMTKLILWVLHASYSGISLRKCHTSQSIVSHHLSWRHQAGYLPRFTQMYVAFFNNTDFTSLIVSNFVRIIGISLPSSMRNFQMIGNWGYGQMRYLSRGDLNGMP